MLHGLYSIYRSRFSQNFNCGIAVFSGKLKTPKWKNFKGIQVGRKDKIRLNNLIWREWHMQCSYLSDIPLYLALNSVVAETFCYIIWLSVNVFALFECLIKSSITFPLTVS